MRSAKDNFLRAMFECCYIQGKTNNKQLAEFLKISPAAVTEFVGKMQKKGFVSKKRYGSFSLTKKGEQTAILVLKKFRLCEVWLERNFNLTPVEISRQAWKMADFDDVQLFEELNQQLDWPETTLFGNAVQEPQLLCRDIAQLTPDLCGKTVILSEYLDEERTISFVRRIGLQLGQKLEVKQYSKEFRSLIIQTGNREFSVNENFGNSLYVQEKEPWPGLKDVSVNTLDSILSRQIKNEKSAR